MSVLFTRSFRRACAAALLSAVLPATASASSYGEAGLSSRMLRSHNSVRAAAGVPTLVWDQRLQAEAAGYAQYLARRNVFRHSSRESRGGTGENLWMGTHGAFTLEGMFGGWLSEQPKFRPGIFPAVSRTGSWHDVGHYTQIVWPQTRRVGCAIGKNASFDFLVCRYWPAGNVHGQPLSNGALMARAR